MGNRIGHAACLLLTVLGACSSALAQVRVDGAPVWIDQGPGPIIGGQTETVSPPPFHLGGAVTGAIQAVAAHPTNPDIALIGAVNGGIWRTTNARADAPVWTPVLDNMPSLAIGDIKFSPLNANVIYAGINQTTNNGGLASYPNGLLRGVLRSTDGGLTWAIQSTTQAFLANGVNGAVNGGVTTVVPTRIPRATIDTQVVLVATTNGLWRSTDGGRTWTNIAATGTSGLPVTPFVTDLADDPGDPSGMRLYAGVQGAGVFRTLDGGLTWEAINGGLGTPASIVNVTRIRISVHFNAAAGTNSVFVALARGGGVLISRSTNATSSPASAVRWTTMSFISDCRGTLNPGGNTGVNLSLVADRTDSNVVFAGGDRANPCGLEFNFTARIFRGDASRSLGQWDSVTNLGAVGPPLAGLVGSSPHADSRNMVFDADGNILEVDDGGIYRLLGPNNISTARRWASAIGNLQVSEIVGVAYDHLNDRILAGAQDVGTFLQVDPGSRTWGSDAPRGGDGSFPQAFVGSDFRGPFAVHYSSAQGLTFFDRRVFGRGVDSLTQPVGLNVLGATPPVNLISFDPSVQFFQPYAINAVNPNRMLIGTQFIYESANQGDDLNVIGGVNPAGNGPNPSPVSGGQVTSIVYGGFADTNGDGIFEPFPDVAWIGTTNGLFQRTLPPSTPSANNLVNLTVGLSRAMMPSGNITAFIVDITVDPNDFRRAYVLDNTNRIWFTRDIGVNWNEVTGDIAQLFQATGMPLVLRTIELVPRRLPQSAPEDTLLVGGSGGVFKAQIRNPTAPVRWVRYGGLPGSDIANVIVTDLHYDSAADVLVAGTLGRGVWRVNNVRATIQVPQVLRVSGTTGDDNILLVRNAGNPLMLDVIDNSVRPPGMLGTIALANVQQIIIDTLGGNDSVTLDFSNGEFVPSGGIQYDGGSNVGTPGDSLVVTGNGTMSLGPFNSDGTFPFGRGFVTFRNLEPVLVRNFGTLLFVSAHNRDVISIETTREEQEDRGRISGTSDNEAFESVSFVNVANVLIDTSTNDSGSAQDTITLAGVGRGLQQLTLRTGPGDDVIRLIHTGTALRTVIDTGAGNDSIVFSQFMGGPSQARRVSVDGGLGDDRLIIDWSTSPISSNWTVRPNSAALSDVPVLESYRNVETVSLSMGSGDDQIRIVGTDNSTHTTIETGGGADTIHVHPEYVANLTVMGQEPTGETGDRLVLEPPDLTIPSPSIEIVPGLEPGSGQVRVGIPRLSYSGIEQLTARSFLDVLLDLIQMEAILASLRSGRFQPEHDLLLFFTSMSPLRPIPPVELINTRQLSVLTASGSDHSVIAESSGLRATLKDVVLIGGAYSLKLVGQNGAPLPIPALSANVSSMAQKARLDIQGTAMTVSTSQFINSLDIGAGGTILTAPGRDKVLDVGNLTINTNAGGRLDLADNWMIVRSDKNQREATLNRVTALVTSARGKGDFAGPGIGTSRGDKQSGKLIGVISNVSPSGKQLYSTFAGRAIDENCLLVAYTYAGDLDLDGDVDMNDYARLQAGIKSQLSGYENGDIDYSGGPPDATDIAILKSAIASAKPSMPLRTAAPTKLKVEPSAMGLDLSWQDNALNETGYLVERKTRVTEKYSVVAQLPAGTTSFLDNQIRGKGRAYYYRVTALSNQTEPTPASVKASGMLLLSPPSDLIVTALNDSSTSMSWKYADTDHTGFLIERRRGGKPWAKVGSVGPKVLGFVDSDPLFGEGEPVTYRVRAIGLSAKSAPSSEVSLSLALAAPTKLTITTDILGFVNLSWENRSKQATEYLVERKSSNQTNYVEVVRLPGTVSRVIDGGASEGTVSSYRITALGTELALQSVPSEITIVVPPVAPTKLRVSVVSRSVLQLRWRDISMAELGYELERCIGEEGKFVTIKRLQANEMYYTDKLSGELTEGMVVYYRVRPIGLNNMYGSYSNVASATMTLDPPLGVTGLLDINKRDVRLGWKDTSTHETGYQIHRKMKEGKYEIVTSLPANTMTYLDQKLEPGSYAYRVFALGAGTSSPYSEEVSVEVP